MGRKDGWVNARTENSKGILAHNLVKGLYIVLGTFFLIVLVTNVILIVKGSLNEKEVPTIFGIARMAVLTDSMKTKDSNSIKSGDLIFAQKVNTDTLKIDDIILFHSRGSTVIHRIIAETDEKEFITKGDANTSEDIDPVAKKRIIGKYVGRLPFVGRVVLFSKTPLGMLCFIGLPLLFIWTINRQSRRQEKKLGDEEKNEKSDKSQV